MASQWLEPNEEDEQQKEYRRRLINEQSLKTTIEKLDELRKPRQPSNPVDDADMVKAASEALKKKDMPIFKPTVHEAQLPKQQRIDPKGVIERPDPKVISEGYQPRTLQTMDTALPVVESPQHPQDAKPTINTKQQNENEPDIRLLEIARLWSRLSERDREEMMLMAKMKVHLNTIESKP